MDIGNMHSLATPENYMKVRCMELTQVKFSLAVDGLKLFLPEKFA